jgi:hypothetical protein
MLSFFLLSVLMLSVPLLLTLIEGPNVATKTLKQGSLTEGEGSLQLTSLAELVLYQLIFFENVIHLYHKTSYPNEEVNCTEHVPSVSIPWLKRLSLKLLTTPLRPR